MSSKYARVVSVELGDFDSEIFEVGEYQSTLFLIKQEEKLLSQVFVHRDDPLRTVKLSALAESLAHVPMTEAAIRAQSITLVICTRDRPEELRRCLASLTEQTRQPDEVIVVDNASQNSALVREIVESAGYKYQLEERPGLDFARNAGLAAGTSDIIAFADDDTVQREDWLEKIVEAFDTPDIYAVTGLVLPAELETEAQFIFEKEWSFGRGFSRRDFRPEWFHYFRTHPAPVWTIGAGASMAFRRKVSKTVGWFDERLDVGAAGCSGDSEYWYRILAAGKTCRYDPAIVSFHYHRRDIDGLKKQVRAYMRGHLCALLIQWQQTRRLGNLRRAFLTLPFSMLRRRIGKALRGARADNMLIDEEIAGAVEGLQYFWRTRNDAGRDGRLIR